MNKLNKKNIVFIAQGIPHYSKLISKLKKKGFNLITIDLEWNRNIISDWVVFSEKKIPEINSSETIVVGHSIGASLAIILAQKYNFYKTLAFSPSPIFKESLKLLNSSAKKQLGLRRLEDIKKNYSLKMISSKINKRPICIYIGSEEHIIIKKNAKIISGHIKNLRVSEINNRKHLDVINDLLTYI